MALKNRAQNTTEETTEQGANTEPEANQTTTARETASTAEVAVRKTAAPPAQVGDASVFISNPDFLDAVADAEYGTFPSVVASGGSHMISGTDIDLGKVLRFQGILTKQVKKVTPGDNSEEAKEYFAVSNDGETVTDGRSIEEALQDALDAGYAKAAIKDYIDVICIITECDDDDYVGETVTLQLSPSSQYTWKPLAGKCKMKKAMGKLVAEPILGDPDLGSAVVFTSTAKNTSWKGNNFTKFEFSI